MAAMRELLIIDGKIDARKMNIVVPPLSSSGQDACHVSLPGSNEKKRTRSKSDETDKTAAAATSTLSDDDDDDETNEPSLSKKHCAQNSSVDSLVDLQDQLLRNHGSSISNQPHVVPSAERKSFDYSQFRSAEELVEFVVNRATLFGTVTPEQSTSVEEQNVTSKRKVSDVDDIMETQDKGDTLSFHSSIVSLVRSNTMIFQTFSSGASSTLTKLQNCLPESALTELERNIFHSTLSSQTTMTELLLENFEKVNDILLEFLRFPQLQRQRQHESANKSLFVLPQLLEASVTDESHLREYAHNMIISMVNSIPGNDFEIPLRAFLGYKSLKTPSRERILEMVSGVLFDVSHAMHAWVHTEKDLVRKKQVSNRAIDSKYVDEQIKNALFDQNRAIQKIGGFDDSSLLPLALGIHRCRQTKTTWTEYASSTEGKKAFSLHTNAKAEERADRKRQPDNAGLFETGRKRRGRRGRSINSHRISAK